jgi:hypothetical protein
MPDRTRCIACNRVGFVRREHVIEKGKSHIQYYCGSCEKTWTVPDSDAMTERPARNKKPERPKK